MVDFLCSHLFEKRALLYTLERRSGEEKIEAFLNELPSIEVLTLDIRSSELAGRIYADLERAGDDREAAMDVGVRQAVRQVKELLERGVPGVHFYVLNKSAATSRVLESLRASK